MTLCQLNVPLGKFAVGVQHLTKAQADALPGVGGDGKLQYTRNILPEIQHGFAAGGVNGCGGKLLLFLQRLIVGRCGLHRVGGTFGMTAVGRHTACVHALTVLVVGKTDRTVIRPLPAAVRANRLHGAVRHGQLQLG